MARCRMMPHVWGLVLTACWIGLPLTANATPPPETSVEGLERCASCHAIEAGGKAKWGPNLFGVFDRPVGAQSSYRYGSYLRQQSEAGATWDEVTLREWLVDSKSVARAAQARTKMPAQRLSDDQLDGIIRYLQALR